MLEHQLKVVYSLKFLWNRLQLVYHDFCLFYVLSKVLLQRNLCFISDQLRASETSDDHRHALFQVLLCFYFSFMFYGIVWWSGWRRRRRRRCLGRCHKVCSHIIICCFLWMYRSAQFEHCIGSLLTHCCMTLLSALFYISSCSIGNTVYWSV